MNDIRLRKEKNCLNCGQEVTERFCSHCGQENIEPREGFWQLLVHFFNDFTHFDGKFFSTISILMLQPGKLTQDYIAGKRASYLNPIRMYLFISLTFFVVQYLLPPAEEKEERFGDKVMTKASVVSLLDSAISQLNKNINDSSPEINKLLTEEKIVRLKKSRWLLQFDSTQLNKVLKNLPDSSYMVNGGLGSLNITPSSKNIPSHSTIDTLMNPSLYEYYQQQLPVEKRDGKFTHFIKKRTAELQEKYNGEEGKFSLDLEKKFSLYFPKLIFVSLPISAWMLLLLYRRRKKWWYTEHTILTIHLYCATFLIMLIQVLFSALLAAAHLPLLKTVVDNLFFFAILLYQFFTLYRFYQQSLGKTLLKTFLLLLLQAITIGFLIMIFLFISLASL